MDVDRSNFGQEPDGLFFRRHFLIVCNAVKQFLTPKRPLKARIEGGFARLPLVSRIGAATSEGPAA
jgi:hypothetical protein